MEDHHNGVDTHAIHFHLFNVQLLNRIGWDGTNRPPDANELGWKETVRMNPLEIEFVALRPMSQNLPWPIPDSIRPLDVTMPPEAQDPMMFLLTGTGTPADQINHVTNFGWEYVWHCHLLGHEENDMMRPMVLQVPPPAPSNFNAIIGVSGISLSFTDNSASETSFELQRATDAAFTLNLAPTTLPANNLPAPFGVSGTVATIDNPAPPLPQYYYRVRAVSGNGASAWVTTQAVTAPIAELAPTSLTFADQAVNTVSASQTVTLSNTGSASLTGISIAITGTNSADFSLASNGCGATLAVNGSCQIMIASSPLSLGAKLATLSVSDNAAGSPQTVPLTGAGVAATPAVMISPVPGSTLTSASTTFTWNAGSGGVTGYYLWVGTSAGTANLVEHRSFERHQRDRNSAHQRSHDLRAALDSLQRRRTYLSNDYTYTEVTQSAAASPARRRAAR